MGAGPLPSLCRSKLVFQSDLFSLALDCKRSNTITYTFKFRFLLFIIYLVYNRFLSPNVGFREQQTALGGTAGVCVSAPAHARVPLFPIERGPSSNFLLLH